MQKDGFLYKKMAKYRLKFLIVSLIVLFLFALYTIISIPYLRAAFGEPKELDTERFFKETSFVTIDKPIELGRKDHKTPQISHVKQNTYWQGNVYDFNINADSATPLGKTFKSKNQTTGEETDLYTLHMAEVDGKKMVVIAYPNTKVGTEIKNCNLMYMQKSIAAAVSETLEGGEKIEISSYVIDLTGSEMDAESTDIIFFWLFLIITVFLWGKLLLYYINPKLTPTFRQLYKYGDIEEISKQIDAEVISEQAHQDADMLVTENFVITKSTFKAVVARNHMAKH